jgi:hypothetical protein
LEKYFDAFVYVANWDVRRFWLRLPKAWIEYETVRRMLPGDAVWAQLPGQHIIVDYAPLDTLFLAMPISWRGTLHQYVGRLHRLHDQKKEVVVYDYVDTHTPCFSKFSIGGVEGCSTSPSRSTQS